MSQPRANSFSIIELIKYVCNNGQTGRLLFLENDRLNAEIYFNKGHMRHAKNTTLTGDDVIYQLLGNKTAEVRWERNVAPVEDSIDLTKESRLLGALGILTGEAAAKKGHARTDQGIPVEISQPKKRPVNIRILPARKPTTASPVNHPDNHQGPDTAAIAPKADMSQADALTSTSEANRDGAEQLRQQLGDEVLRPPRFKHWTGLPLPFVSAFGLEPADGQLKTAYDVLWKASFSGFITCSLARSEGFSLLYQGRIIHSRFADDQGKHFSKDKDALHQIINQQIPTSGKNCVLIYPLEPEFVHSYSALIIGEAELNGLSSQSVKLNKLLNTLEQGNRTGVVHITNAEENGYIFLNTGRKLGSYYEVEEVLEESILRVYQIVGKTDSIIDVLIAPSEDKLFDYASRPRSVREIKLEIVELAEEILGKRSNRVVQLLIQSEENLSSLINCCNQARRVAEMSTDKNLAEQFYKRAMLLLLELG